jgi:hypothetical protein
MGVSSRENGGRDARENELLTNCRIPLDGNCNEKMRMIGQCGTSTSGTETCRPGAAGCSMQAAVDIE